MPGASRALIAIIILVSVHARASSFDCPLAHAAFDRIGAMWHDVAGFVALESDPTDAKNAVRHFEFAARLENMDFIAMLCLADAQRAAKDYDAALKQLTQVERNWPGWTSLYVVRSNVYRDQKRYELARSEMQKALKRWPNNEDLHIELGKVCEKQKDIDEAIGQYRAAVQINPRSIVAHNHLSIALYSKGRNLELAHRPDAARPIYEEVARELQTVSTLNSRYFPVYMSSGAILTNMGAFAKAELAFRNAVYLRPNHADALTSLAMVQIKLHRTEDAIEHLRAAMRLDPKLARPHYLMGTLLADEKDLDAAIEHFQKAVDLGRAADDASESMYEQKLAQMKQQKASAASAPH